MVTNYAYSLSPFNNLSCQFSLTFCFLKLLFRSFELWINFGFWFVFNCSVFKVQCLFFVFGFRRQHLISYHNSFRLSTTFFIFLNLFSKPFFKLSFSVVVFVVFSGEQDSIILFLQKMSTLFFDFFKIILIHTIYSKYISYFTNI